jgi:TATA-box binding protein (TBP) (component of TFIID and TFIIIB)
MWKRYRISANINGTKAIDTKKCYTFEEACQNLLDKVNKIKQKRQVNSIKMVAGILMNETVTEFSIARFLHTDLRQYAANNFPGIDITVSDYGIS